jgi:hyperosmotically inducible protein
MSLRLGALLCVFGSIACSHDPPPRASAASDAQQQARASTDPVMKPASLENSAPVKPAAPSAAASHRDFEGTEGKASPKSPSTAQADVPSASTVAPDATKRNDAPENAKRNDAPDNTKRNVAPDNTKRNERDRNGAALTPLDQSNGEADLKITQQIRKSVMADGSLSFTAKNVKIITQNGHVTLRGPVKTEQERSAIEAAARQVAGTIAVDNQIEVIK